MEELVALLGQGSEVAESYFSDLGILVSARERIDTSDFVEAAAHGVSWVVDAANRVSALQLHAEGHEGYAAWSGEMPFGVTFQSSRDDVRRVLGPPDEAGEPSVVPVLGPKPAWDKFHFGGATLHLEYSERPAGGVQLISVLPRS